MFYAFWVVGRTFSAWQTASCSKIEEQVREERIPLPQARIDGPDPDWNDPAGIDGKHTKP